jgi:hypothetical protein
VGYASLGDEKTGNRVGPFLRDDISIVRDPSMGESLILSYGHKASQYITETGDLKSIYENKQMEGNKPTQNELNEKKDPVPTTMHSGSDILTPAQIAEYRKLKQDGITSRSMYLQSTLDDVGDYVASNKDLAGTFPDQTVIREMAENGTPAYLFYQIACSALNDRKEQKKEIELLRGEQAKRAKLEEQKPLPPTTSSAAGRRDTLDEANAALMKGRELLDQAYKKNAAKLTGLLDPSQVNSSFQEKVNAISQKMASGTYSTNTAQ